jgi:hypothetical protein
LSDKSEQNFIDQDNSQLSTKFLVEHLSKITDVEPEIIDACQLPKEQLVSIFGRAVHYFYEIAKSHKELEELPDSQTVFFPGRYDYGYDEKITENSVKAARINAKIVGYEQGLTRLATSLVGIATIKAR